MGKQKRVLYSAQDKGVVVAVAPTKKELRKKMREYAKRVH